MDLVTIIKIVEFSAGDLIENEPISIDRQGQSNLCQSWFRSNAHFALKGTQNLFE